MATGISKTKWNSKKKSTATLGELSLKVELSYEGKLPEQEILEYQSDIDFTNIHVYEKGTDQLGLDFHENKLFFGDNYEVMSSLLESEEYRGKVKLIYIDPPFATKSVFKNRKEKDAYQDLLSGAHYIDFLRKRLILMRELLSEDGSIFLHLDENMAFHAKVLLDEIFGESNFQNFIVRKKCNPKNFTTKKFGNISDYILFYSKNSKKMSFNKQYIPWTTKTASKEYQYKEEGTERIFKKVPVHAPGTRNGATGGLWKGKLPPEGKHWQYTPDKLDAMDERGEIYWSANGNPRRKVYLDESKGIAVQDIWMGYKDAHNQNIKITGYPTEKNPDLLERIVNAASNEGDLVLDAFCGSGTTLEVAHKNARKWIGIDSGLESVRTILHRNFDGRKAMGDFVKKKNKTNDVTESGNYLGNFELFSDSNKSSDILNYLKKSKEFKNLTFDVVASTTDKIQ